MVDWVLEAQPLGPEPLVVIASPESRDAFGDVEVAVQEQRARDRRCSPRRPRAVGDEPDSLLVLSGDTPLLTTELLGSSSSRPTGGEDAAATVLTFEPDDARSYGRFVRAEDGTVAAIVEAGDATPEQLELRECNSSIYVFRTDLLGRPSTGSSPTTRRASSI